MEDPTFLCSKGVHFLICSNINCQNRKGAWKVSRGTDPTFFFLFLTQTYSLSGLEHYELIEPKEEVSVAAVAVTGGAETNVAVGEAQALVLQGGIALPGVP